MHDLEQRDDRVMLCSTRYLLFETGRRVSLESSQREMAV